MGGESGAVGNLGMADPNPPGRNLLPRCSQGPPEVYVQAAVDISALLAKAHPETTAPILKEAIALQNILNDDSVPAMLSLVRPWAVNFASIFLGELEQHRILMQQQIATTLTPSSSIPSPSHSVHPYRNELSSTMKGFSEPLLHHRKLLSSASSSSRAAKSGPISSNRSLYSSTEPFPSRSSAGGNNTTGPSSGPICGYESEGTAPSSDLTSTSKSSSASTKVPLSESELMLVSLFKMTRTCRWPPQHTDRLRMLWETVFSTPEASDREAVAVHITEFLLQCHFTAGEASADAAVASLNRTRSGGSHRSSFGRSSSILSARSDGDTSSLSGLTSAWDIGSLVGSLKSNGNSPPDFTNDQQLVKLVLAYGISSGSGRAILARLAASMRSYPLDDEEEAASLGQDYMTDGRGSLDTFRWRGGTSVAWQTAGGFVLQPLSLHEHSTLTLVADIAYQQDTVLVPHLPLLLHSTLVLLRPRREHRCGESHAIIPYLVHSLCVRGATSTNMAERGQAFLNTYYPLPPSGSDISSDASHELAGGEEGDPEERLSTTYVMELFTILQSHRPDLRAEWARLALAWAIGSTDKRIVVASLRLFAILNQSISASVLYKVAHLMLASLRIGDGSVAETVFEIFVRAVARLRRERAAGGRRSTSWDGCVQVLASIPLAAMSMSSVRLFHKAITLLQSLYSLQMECKTDGGNRMLLSLEAMWRLVPNVPLDVPISDLLFRGLLTSNTAAATLWLFETFAMVYANMLSANNKLVITVLLVSAGLVQLGEEGRCRAVMRFIDKCGFALSDMNGVFLAHENGYYNFPLVPTVLQVKASVEPPSAEESTAAAAATIRRQSLRDTLLNNDDRFLSDFFDAFSLAFPSEEVWAFALQFVVGIIRWGQLRWRPAFLKLLRTLLLYHLNMWSDAHFAVVADMLVQLSSGESSPHKDKSETATGRNVKVGTQVTGAQEDIFTLLLEYASPAISKRVFDALQGTEDNTPKADPSLTITSTLQSSRTYPTQREVDAHTNIKSHSSSKSQVAEDLFTAPQSVMDNSLLKSRAERWFVDFILQRARSQATTEAPEKELLRADSGMGGIELELRSDDESETEESSVTKPPRRASWAEVGSRDYSVAFASSRRRSSVGARSEGLRGGAGGTYRRREEERSTATEEYHMPLESEDADLPPGTLIIAAPSDLALSESHKRVDSGHRTEMADREEERNGVRGSADQERAARVDDRVHVNAEQARAGRGDDVMRSVDPDKDRGRSGDEGLMSCKEEGRRVCELQGEIVELKAEGDDRVMVGRRDLNMRSKDGWQQQQRHQDVLPGNYLRSQSLSLKGETGERNGLVVMDKDRGADMLVSHGKLLAAYEEAPHAGRSASKLKLGGVKDMFRKWRVKSKMEEV